MTLLPKPVKRIKTRKSNRDFQEMIVGIDGRCMNPHCDLKSRSMLWAHHILLKSHGRYDTKENGITLCVVCHQLVHGVGCPDLGEGRISMDAYMLMILTWYLGHPEDRWQEVRGIIRQRVERKRIEVISRYRSK